MASPASGVANASMRRHHIVVRGRHSATRKASRATAITRAPRLVTRSAALTRARSLVGVAARSVTSGTPSTVKVVPGPVPGIWRSTSDGIDTAKLSTSVRAATSASSGSERRSAGGSASGQLSRSRGFGRASR